MLLQQLGDGQRRMHSGPDVNGRRVGVDQIHAAVPSALLSP